MKYVDEVKWRNFKQLSVQLDMLVTNVKKNKVIKTNYVIFVGFNENAVKNLYKKDDNLQIIIENRGLDAFEIIKDFNKKIRKIFVCSSLIDMSVNCFIEKIKAFVNIKDVEIIEQASIH